MELIKIKTSIPLLLIFFFSYEIIGMLGGSNLSEPTKRVRDRALALSKQQRLYFQAQQREPQAHTFKPKAGYELPRSIKILSQDEIVAKLEQIKSQLNDNEFFVYQAGTAERY